MKYNHNNQLAPKSRKLSLLKKVMHLLETIISDTHLAKKYLIKNKGAIFINNILIPAAITLPVLIYYGWLAGMDFALSTYAKLYFFVFVMFNSAPMIIEYFYTLRRSLQLTIAGFFIVFHLFLYSFIEYSAQNEINLMVGNGFEASKRLIHTYHFFQYIQNIFVSIIGLVFLFFFITLSKIPKIKSLIFFKMMTLYALIIVCLLMTLQIRSPLLVKKNQLITRLDFVNESFCGVNNLKVHGNKTANNEQIVFFPSKVYGDSYLLLNCDTVNESYKSIKIWPTKLSDIHGTLAQR